jgi:hypothetical protein
VGIAERMRGKSISSQRVPGECGESTTSGRGMSGIPNFVKGSVRSTATSHVRWMRLYRLKASVGGSQFDTGFRLPVLAG